MKIQTIYLSFLLFVIMLVRSEAQAVNDNHQVFNNSIRWLGTNETANYLALQGLQRYITYENSHAFVLTEAAIRLDSSLFASHVILSFLSTGSRKEHHKKLAEKFVHNENEVSKLFVNLLDFDETNDSQREQRRKIWTKMHQITADPFIHYMYIRYMEGADSAVFAELEDLIEFCEKNRYSAVATAANNMKGYILKRNGNLESGTQAIEACLKLHPEGYNPIDSRAEFYLFAADTIKAIEFYKKVLEKFPYAQYAKDQLEALDP